MPHRFSGAVMTSRVACSQAGWARVAAIHKAVASVADILRDVFIDSDAGNITLSKYARETWLPAQTFSPSTGERVESRLRLHILPNVGGGKGLGSYSLSQLARSPSVIQAWLRGLRAIDRAFSETPDHPEITQEGETGL